MLDEDGGGDVAGKVVFLSKAVDLLKILHDWLLKEEGVVEIYYLCVALLSCCSGLTCVDSLAVFVMQVSEYLSTSIICLISPRRLPWLPKRMCVMRNHSLDFNFHSSLILPPLSLCLSPSPSLLLLPPPSFPLLPHPLPPHLSLFSLLYLST